MNGLGDDRKSSPPEQTARRGFLSGAFSCGGRLGVAHGALGAEVAEHDELALATRAQIAGFVGHGEAVLLIGASAT